MSPFLESSDVIDWHHPAVRSRARMLAEGLSEPTEIARACFEWVRDEIRHSIDYGLNVVTCTASEVLEHGSGFCYAKSHLLAALLRANGLPAGLCYQRLSQNGQGSPYCLHGLNAVWLPAAGWYRIDARGNRAEIDAQFIPPVEQLAFEANAFGEADLPEIWVRPLSVVVERLRSHNSTDSLSQDLPDVELWSARP